MWSHGLQHARLPSPSLSPRVCSNLCTLGRWCHPTISSSVIPFSFCLQSFPASGSFPVSRLFASGGQSVEASASASVLPMKIEGWFPFVDPPLLSPLFSCEEATKLLSPERCVPSTTSVGPSYRSALELHIHTARDGDFSGSQRAHRSVTEGGLGQVAGWSCCGEGRHCSENRTHTLVQGWPLKRMLVNSGAVKIPVIRHGTDLSTFMSVWCATRPSDPASATPGVDYVPSSRKLEFGQGVTEQVRMQRSKARWVVHVVSSLLSKVSRGL